MKPGRALLIGLMSCVLGGCGQGSFVYSSGSGGYANEVDYNESKIEWLDADKPIQERIAMLEFAAGYLKFVQTLGPAFQNDKVEVIIAAVSADQAIAQLEKETGAMIPRRITGPDKVKINLSGSQTGTELLLKIIDISGMVPAFEGDKVLVLTPPPKKP